MTWSQERVAEEIRKVQAEDLAMLLKKQAAYGNAAIDPLRVFSRVDPVEQLKVRIDDKLSRMARGSVSDEDVTRDLRGYLLLLEVAERMTAEGAVAGDAA